LDKNYRDYKNLKNLNCQIEIFDICYKWYSVPDRVWKKNENPPQWNKYIHHSESKFQNVRCYYENYTSPRHIKRYWLSLTVVDIVFYWIQFRLDKTLLNCTVLGSRGRIKSAENNNNIILKIVKMYNWILPKLYLYIDYI